jgi:hypothetical protein
MIMELNKRPGPEWAGRTTEKKSCRTLVRGYLKHVHKKLIFETARDK